MTRPNKMTCDLLTAAVEDADRVASYYRSLADNVVALRDGMADGDAEKIMRAMVVGRKLAIRTAHATGVLMTNVALATSFDKPTFDAANRKVSADLLRAELEELPDDELAVEREHHNAKCDGVDCVAHLAIEEEVARRAPH